jgi:nicotinamidase-related amidase
MGVERVVVVGAVAAFCVTSTVRSASDLGFAVLLPGDALLAFDLAALDGGRLDARDILRMTLAVLGADFARVLRADEVAAVIDA